jgi:hypothetical protein
VKRLLDARVYQLSFEQLTELMAGATWEDFEAFLLENCPDLGRLPDATLREIYQAFWETLRKRIGAIPAPHHGRVGTA